MSASKMDAIKRQAMIEQIRQLPAQIEALVKGLADAELGTHFLAGEWTVAQNVHHLADSHMNSYVRCKLMATEDHPPLKPYDQDKWAALPDASSTDVSTSLALLAALHARWVVFWENLDDEMWARTGKHLSGSVVTLEHQLRLYVDHGHAHIDQITRTLAAGGDAA